jgi:hypothetical protein
VAATPRKPNDPTPQEGPSSDQDVGAAVPVRRVVDMGGAADTASLVAVGIAPQGLDEEPVTSLLARRPRGSYEF